MPITKRGPEPITSTRCSGPMLWELSGLTKSSRIHQIDEHTRLVGLFPDNIYVQRLVDRAETLGISFATSPVKEQWLYHPEHERIYVWEPDLALQSLSYLVVILAHELGHARDFEENPAHLRLTRNLLWSEVPHSVEIAAFVNGFAILKELWIPVSLDQYILMISPEIAVDVRRQIEGFRVCCLLSPRRASTTVQRAQAAS